MSVVRSLRMVGKVTMAQVQSANGSLGGQWLSAINIAEQVVTDDYPQVNAIQIAGAKAHQSHEVASHSNILSVKFFAGSRRVISGHIHMNGQLEYSKPAHGSSRFVPSHQSSSTPTTSDPQWRWNEQGRHGEYSWDGVNYYPAEWADEYQKWYTSHNGQWYYDPWGNK